MLQAVIQWKGDNLRRYLRAQSQGHGTIDRLEERGVERGFTRQSSLKALAIVNQTSVNWNCFQRQRSEKQGWSAYGFFRAHRYRLEQN